MNTAAGYADMLLGGVKQAGAAGRRLGEVRTAPDPELAGRTEEFEAAVARQDPTIRPAVRERAQAQVATDAKPGKTVRQSVADHLKGKGYLEDRAKRFGHLAKERVQRARDFEEPTIGDKVREFLTSERLGRRAERAGENIIRAYEGRASVPFETESPKLRDNEQRILEEAFGLEKGDLKGSDRQFVAQVLPSLTGMAQSERNAELKELTAMAKIADMEWKRADTLVKKEQQRDKIYHRISRDFAKDTKQLREDRGAIEKFRRVIRIGKGVPGELPGNGIAGRLATYIIAKIGDSGGRLSDKDVEQFASRPGNAGWRDKLIMFIKSNHSKEYYNNVEDLAVSLGAFFDEDLKQAEDIAVNKAKAIYRSWDLEDERVRMSLTGVNPNATTSQVRIEGVVYDVTAQQKAQLKADNQPFEEL
jgi:hypothetical protein